MVDEQGKITVDELALQKHEALLELALSIIEDRCGPTTGANLRSWARDIHEAIYASSGPENLGGLSYEEAQARGLL